METKIHPCQALYVIEKPDMAILDSLGDAITHAGPGVNWHVFIEGMKPFPEALRGFGHDLTTMLCIPQVHQGDLVSYALNYFWAWMELLPAEQRKWVCIIQGRHQFFQGWLEKCIEALEGEEESIAGFSIVTPQDFGQSAETNMATELVHHIEPHQPGVWVTDYNLFVRHGFPGIEEKPHEYYGESMSKTGEIFGGLNDPLVEPLAAD